MANSVGLSLERSNEINNGLNHIPDGQKVDVVIEVIGMARNASRQTLQTTEKQAACLSVGRLANVNVTVNGAPAWQYKFPEGMREEAESVKNTLWWAN